MYKPKNYNLRTDRYQKILGEYSIEASGDYSGGRNTYSHKPSKCGYCSR